MRLQKFFILSGFIGKITLQIPLSRLHSEPWVISMERLYLVAGPLKDVQVSEFTESVMVLNFCTSNMFAVITLKFKPRGLSNFDKFV